MAEAEARSEITRILQTGKGDGAVVNELLPVVYEQLRRIAASRLRGERVEHTLSPTALVHEVYLRLMGSEEVPWQNRVHFYAAAARGMRQVLIDHARRHRSDKRGGKWQRVTLDDALRDDSSDVDFLDLHDALERLESLDPAGARIVELRFFAGLTLEDTANVLGLSRRKVAGDWAMARAWLSRELGGSR